VEGGTDIPVRVFLGINGLENPFSFPGNGCGSERSATIRHYFRGTEGRDAVEWTIRMKDPIAGGSMFWLNDTVDGGPGY